ncbi:single-stranded-DNA-specific exonuclease RecJ [Lachnospiraceae bacterium C1.1]|nr:single-stranded-DNA-specific exonuclease RecJ [Lachnospiraceae bacterium C1.1]
MKEKWFVITKGGDYRALGAKYGVSPVIARIMRNRGIMTDDEAKAFLNTGVEGLYDGSLFKDAEKLINVLKAKIEGHKKIRVIGDYDIDGVCSTYILLQGLKTAGADVDEKIPHRVKDGYGLNENLIRSAYDDGIDTIITCDNGIAAINEIKLAGELGMTVLVTDHHQVPYEETESGKKEKLVSAEAIVDPHRNGDEYPYKTICGAVVAWKIIISLFKAMGIDEVNAERFFELAAFATIGDVMPLSGENRIIVKNGLLRLEKTDNIGLRALIAINELDEKSLSPYHVGFILGPCMNAAGRLESAETALQLLMSETAEEAHSYAVTLKDLNDSRKALTDKGVKAALEIASLDEYQKDKILVIALKDCHESIAGIIAGKVREATGKPSFILTDGKTADGKDCLKGSGRSIDEYNMFEGMSKVSECFLKFGGHATAAGLSLEKDKLAEFREKINAGADLTEDDLAVKVHIDMVIPLNYVTYDLVEELKILEPFGTANEKPLFAAKDLEVIDGRVLGERRNVYKCRVKDQSGTVLDAIYFGEADAFEKHVKEHEKISVTFNPDINEFRGSRTLQLVVRNYM